MRRVLLLSLLVAGTAAAQAPRTIAPGMTRAQVEERLGPPLTTRAAGNTLFLFYHNGCERRCGMHDLVVLDSDRVTDAVFRSPERHYNGVSSSPEPISAVAAARRAGAEPAPAGHPIPSTRPPAPPSRAPARPHTQPAAMPPRTRTPQPASATVPARSEIRIPIDAKSKKEVKKPED